MSLNARRQDVKQPKVASFLTAAVSETTRSGVHSSTTRPTRPFAQAAYAFNCPSQPTVPWYHAVQDAKYSKQHVLDLPAGRSKWGYIVMAL